MSHAEIRVGNTVVLAFDRRPDWPSVPSCCVCSCAMPTRRLQSAPIAGVVTELGDNGFERGGRIEDPMGNIWWVTSHIEDVPEDVMPQRMPEGMDTSNPPVR